MKRILLPLITVILLFTSSFLQAQIVTDTTRFSESVWSMKKKKLVMEYLELSEAQKASFWPIYESFNQTIRYIEMETLEILESYHRTGKTMDSAELERLSKRVMLNDYLVAKVRKQYYRKFSKALNPDIATQFMQFDDTMRMVLRFDVKNSSDQSQFAKASLK
jgi:hypothetical protein